MAHANSPPSPQLLTQSQPSEVSRTSLSSNSFWIGLTSQGMQVSSRIRLFSDTGGVNGLKQCSSAFSQEQSSTGHVAGTVCGGVDRMSCITGPCCHRKIH